ncbi:MAG: hypothetical protein LBU22_05385 [Dysgonamonadaceae bacterium]|jgi:hypothetical protein|nr:hypothetical protein [Dysgonamonadaceae bacterium]
MKKLFYLLAVLPLFTFVTGCSEDEEESLEGTKWEWFEQWEGGTGSTTTTISFGKKEVIITDKDDYGDDGVFESFVTGTYVYKHPKVTIAFTDTDSGEVFSDILTISGNTMTWIDEETGERYVYTKK